MTDEQLLAAGAFEELQDRFRAKLIRYAAHRAADAAPAIVERVFARVRKHAHQFDATKYVQPWLYTITDRMGRQHVQSL